MTDASRSLRRSPFAASWSIVASRRAMRPQPVVGRVGEARCPFCTGNEADTEPEVFAVREAGSRENGPGWSIRVVRNKYPALAPEEAITAPGMRPYDERGAFGYHEVLIDTAEHGVGLAGLTHEHLTQVLVVYRARLRAIGGDRRVRSVLLFRNEGREAGASQAHSHSQMLALAHVPPMVRLEIAKAERYFVENGRCLTCDLLRREADGGARFVARQGGFAAVASFAPRFPYETWIAPLVHAHDFRRCAEADMGDLAALLQQTLRGMEAAIGPFPFNIVLQTSPVRTRPRTRAALHWRLEIVPRVSIHSGLEIGAHMFIVSVPPEYAAERLRGALSTVGRSGD